MTRKEWEELWETTKRIEREVQGLETTSIRRIRIQREVEKIKEKIQEVIGQME